jgi:hypothetical protein
MSIDSDRGLAYVSRYIHLNPRDMGEDPLTYRWSSCLSYLGLAPTPPWLDPWPVLKQFGKDLEEARRNYLFYLKSAPPRRPKAASQDDPVNDFLLDYMVHLETFVCWYAHKSERIPIDVLRGYLGSSSAGAVRVLISRFSRRLSEDQALAAWVSRANVGASPQR